MSRLPFVGLGYGVEPDGWRVALNAARMAETGVYSASRMGANPVHEIGAALLNGGDVWAVTLAAAIATGLAASFMAGCVWRIRGEQSALLGIALAFVPAVYVASTGGKDYPWTLLGLVLATWAAIEDRPWTAGVAMGLAIGCRLSVAPLALVPVLLVFGFDRPRRAKQVLKLLGATVGVAVLAYAPVVAQSGAGFLRTTWAPPLTVERFFHKGVLEVWGLLGALGLASALVAAIVWTRSVPIFATQTPTARATWRWTAWLIGALVPGLLFMRYPSHAGYWVPAVPFVLIMAAERLTASAARLMATALIAGPFILGLRPPTTPEPLPPVWSRPLGRGVLEPLRGPILYDQARRQARMHIAQRTLAELPTLPADATVFVGSWRPMLDVLQPDREGGPRLRYAPSRAELGTASSTSAVTGTTSASLYALPGVLREVQARFGVDLRDRVRPLPSSRP